ncbi:MAG: hypothetical protein ACR2OA_14485 [Rubripirellula sp.]
MRPQYTISDAWCTNIPVLHQIMNGSRSPSDFPSPISGVELQAACAIWEPLHYLLKSLLGWQNPGKGLARWYQAGKPVSESPLLQLVAQLWDKSGAVDYYAAWVWSSVDPTTGEESSCRFTDQKWWDDFHRRPPPAWHTPYHGGNNPLHLGHSDFDPFGEINQSWNLPANLDLHFDKDSHRSVLLVNHIGAWRDALVQAESRLPKIGDHSWYVDVLDRQFGLLGTFRKSRVTGRWFLGKHKIHMQGN